MSTQQSVTACCGPDVVSWDPTGSDTDDVARLFEIHHACNVNSFAWLRGGKAIAVGADDCVVSLYALPGKKVVTTAPKLQHLPSGASPVMTVANMGEHLVFGTYNGNVDVVLLPDIQLKQLHKEAGQAITSIALTPQRRVMMCSANGQVVRTQFDPVSQQRPHYLQCKDTHARTSLAASTVDEQVAAGCLYGGIHVWDAASGLAKHHIQDGDSSLQIAFQLQSANTLLAGSAARTLKVWDLRSAQLVAQTETPKKVTSLARGLTAHDVAIGDATGVVWLHDLRRLDTSVQRLSCGKRHAVTCIVWESNWQKAKSSQSDAAGSSASGAPAGPPRARPKPSAAASNPSSADGLPTIGGSASGSGESSAGEGLQSQGRGAAARSEPGSGVVALGEEQMRQLKSHIDSAGEAQVKRITAHIDAAEARICALVSSQGAQAATPKLHTHTIQEHVDTAMSGLRRDVREWMKAQQLSNLENFQMAQQDLLDVAAKLSEEVQALGHQVSRLQATVEEDQGLKRDIPALP